MKQIKSVLRYPGGKSRAIKIIRPLIPHNFSEFREPFVGGGSVFIDVKQNINPKAKYIINDLNYDLYCFWKYVKTDNKNLYNEIKHIKETKSDGRSLFFEYTQTTELPEFKRAVRFFVLNRITFSGTVDAGGYSEQAFINRFTWSSLERLQEITNILDDVEIYNEDYERFLFEKGENVFIFLDPPYYSQSKSRLYGKRGELHTGFNHERFAENMKKCRHKWLITLDDCEQNRELFNFANIFDWELQYGMNNYKSNTAAKGKELFICNYDIKNDLEKTYYRYINPGQYQQSTLLEF